ncbi:helix-turn-helix transcriptional regulator [Nocardioides KLBMP 9356]|uniref:Helix-turn-helix transcriptional regulator n=1 Tax=Nocardioides potassii TaxID=2911371 RepID=A0ABS9HCC8_9ACTN|nr:helix-turn-helix domain-containing protein [Nocardioides potassii]MCF6377869.1 helix-turn-helix transcriptional regulator [Nocardioides potassii]
MSPVRSRRGSPDAYDFEGTGDEARDWLDKAYGTDLRLSGEMGTIRHGRTDHGDVAVDHVDLDATLRFDAEPMSVLVVVDMLDGVVEYTRDGRTDQARDGDSVVSAGWQMPFTGQGAHYELRATAFTGDALTQAVRDVAPGRTADDLRFTSYVPRTPAAGARWRAIVDELASTFPGDESPIGRQDAVRLLGHTLLETFPNTVVAETSMGEVRRDSRDASPATVRRAVQVIEEEAGQDLSLARLADRCGVTPRALQYAFRRHLNCTPLAYLRRVRLDLVRQSLRDGSASTVGDVASRYGFHNPGRFASDYRQVFGENPAATLARSTP